MRNVSSDQAVGLWGLKLGRRERHVLLNAPGPDEPAGVITPLGSGKGDVDAHRRAIRRLAETGLVDAVWVHERVEPQNDSPRPQQTSLWDEKGADFWGLKPPIVNVADRRRSHAYGIRRRAVRLTPLGAALVAQVGPDLKAGRTIRWERVPPLVLDAGAKAS